MMMQQYMYVRHALIVSVLGLLVISVGVMVLRVYYPGFARAESSQAVECSTYRTKGEYTGTAYASPFSVFARTAEVLLKAQCSIDKVTIGVGYNNPAQFFYRFGYVKVGNGSYKQIPLSGTKQQGDWIVASAQSVVEVGTVSKQEGKVLVYMCELIQGNWKCGCKDAACATPGWMVQKYTYDRAQVRIQEPTPAVGGGVPTVSSLSPTMVTSATQTLTIQGTNFTPTGNTILTSSELPSAFSNISSADGTTITFSFKLSLAKEMRKILEPYKNGGHFDDYAKSVASSIKERLPGYDDAIIPISVAVRNVNGESAPVMVLVNMTKIFEEIKNTTL